MPALPVAAFAAMMIHTRRLGYCLAGNTDGKSWTAAQAGCSSRVQLTAPLPWSLLGFVTPDFPNLSGRQNRVKTEHLLGNRRASPWQRVLGDLRLKRGKEATRDCLLAKEKVASSNLVFRSK